MTFSKTRTPQLLVLVPTRELVVQVVQSVKELTPYMTVEVTGVYGGVNMNTQRLALENGTDIVVATPGRLYDLAVSGALKLNGIKKLVIDEVDEMLNLGFRTQLTNILDILPAKRQNLLFSATMTEEVETLMDTYFNSPERIEAAPVGTPLKNILQKGYAVPNFYTKVNLLKWLLGRDKEMTKVLVFAGTKSLADQLYEQLNKDFPDVSGVIHSNKEQNHRFNTVNQFQSGHYRFIIATDIIARGLDISGVSHVINFDTPEEPANYIHRIGRTGRKDKEGISITFILEREKPYQEQIENLMEYRILMEPLPEDLEISTELTEDEKPKVYMKIPEVRLPKIDYGGGAFHQKSAKNRKVNAKVSHKDKMMQKYGKPKTRGAKKK
jgi:ATP-dependent RNA helicase RhlE